MTESKRTLETLEIVGGALCLDFVNTINSRRNPDHDYITSYSDQVCRAQLVHWKSVGHGDTAHSSSLRGLHPIHRILNYCAFTWIHPKPICCQKENIWFDVNTISKIT